ncbi:NAD(P)/FAD-dependent oxidoreductase [Acidicapsa acidisoli]|uniref:NAD(P)/FAD-dependent oxidoreductase n=1 Tax=Acidicapsa acidisoli TaxID=1615681 RepID=UPI0021E07BE8|nr:FAD-dependent monooxygenase [Acidicapsa acidisoli]
MSVSSVMVDNLVIGGGLAGTMVAIRLAAAGRQVTLVEKESSAHHKVCGEFLSHEAIEYLHLVGVSPSGLGAATIRTLRLSSRREVIETALPFRALSLSRYALDAAMLTCAERRGCTVMRGLFVDQLTTDDNLWFAKFRNGESLCAHTVFLANGKHDLRGWDRSPTGQSDLVAFKLHWQLERSQTEALREAIEIFLFSGGYGGLSLVEKDVANLCLIVRRAELRKIGGWTELFKSILGDNRNLQERMRGAKAMWDRPLAVSSIPYGYLADRPFGLWCVGDQAAVIPSFTGDGMSIALHSAALAAEMYLAGDSADQYYRRLRAQLGRGMSFAALLSRLMVTGVGRNLAPLGFSLFPNAMRRIALSTRIPKQAFLGDSTLLSQNESS